MPKLPLHLTLADAAPNLSCSPSLAAVEPRRTRPVQLLSSLPSKRRRGSHHFPLLPPAQPATPCCCSLHLCHQPDAVSLAPPSLSHGRTLPWPAVPRRRRRPPSLSSFSALCRTDLHRRYCTQQCRCRHPQSMPWLRLASITFSSISQSSSLPRKRNRRTEVYAG